MDVDDNMPLKYHKKILPSISGLRAISILLVLFSHLVLQGFFIRLIEVKTNTPLYSSFTLYGQLGVNVFFVISGFLITSLLIEEENSRKKISLRKFYIRRTLRIFPAYFFLLFIYFLLQINGVIFISNSSWLSAITYTKYFNWRLDWLTAHAWSLSIEEQFYILWPLIFLCGDKLRKIIAIIFFLSVPAIRIITHYHPVSWVNELSIFTRVDAIALGCLFALYKDDVLAFLSKNWLFFLWSSFGIILFWNYLILMLLHFNLPIGFVTLTLGLNNGTMEKLAIAIIIMYYVFGPVRIGFKLLNSKLLNYIGMLSYSIYLWQEFFMCSTSKWYNQFPTNLLCILCAALFSYYLIEKPFLNLKKKFEVTKTGAAAIEINS